MSYNDFFWKLTGGGYRLLRFYDRTMKDLSKPMRSFINLNLAKKSKAKKLLEKSDKLHLGCGMMRLDGFINIDAVGTPAIDFRCNLNRLCNYFSDNSISEIYTCHTLEHLPAKFLHLYLKQFYRLLKKSGILRISVPDIEKCMTASRQPNLSDLDVELLQGVIGGGQDHRYNYHQLFFWPDYLKRKLAAAGFIDISEYPLRPHFAGENVNDASNHAGFEQFGMGLSLNMRAKK